MLAQVALKAYAGVFLLFIILFLFALLKSSSSTLSIGMLCFAASLVGIVIGLLYVSKALSKGKLWAQVCAYIIFIGSGVLAVPLLIVCIADKEPAEDFWDIPALWPALWATIMLCIGIISLIFQKPKNAICILILIACMCGCKEEGPASMIEEMGGIVQYDEKIPERPIVKVFFNELDITDANLVLIKGLTSLKELGIKGTQVGDPGLEHLKGLGSLQRLYLDNTKITDAGLEHLKGLSNLQWLSLANTNVTDAGMEHLKEMRNIQWLNLGFTNVTDVGLEHLKGLTKLGGLRLYGTKITDAGLVHLKGLKSLGELNLSRTQVGDTGLEHLKGLTNLSQLDLIHTQVSDLGIKHLKGMTSLLVVKLPSTRVTDAGGTELKKALPNCKVHARSSHSSY